VNVEDALAALVRDNESLVNMQGKRWIRMFFEDIMAQYRLQRAEWLDNLHAVIRVGKKAIVEHQALTMVLFRRYESIASKFMKSDADWDTRIEIMQGVEEDMELHMEEVAMLEYSLAVIRLLSVCCEGKNPAAEVYAARYLSLKDTIKGIVQLEVFSNGEVAEGVEVAMSCRC